jgi:hypothetical protein
MVEAIIAGIIIMGFLVIVMTTNISAPEEDLTLRAYEILKGTDDKGSLKPLAAGYDLAGINDEVDITPYSHTVQVCNSEGVCQGARPSGKNVWVGSYLIAGNNTFQPLEIKLYIYE